uniref:Uncharacterized protein n=1 Tax=Strongyloides venezuelensis TaxID=75913 RepID=A0A0K0FP01_STRVS
MRGLFCCRGIHRYVVDCPIFNVEEYSPVLTIVKMKTKEEKILSSEVSCNEGESDNEMKGIIDVRIPADGIHRYC